MPEPLERGEEQAGRVKETAQNKPSIPPEVRKRLTEFTRQIEGLQKKYGVAIAIMPSDALGLRDLRRKGNWGGYGEFDALIYNADTKRIPIKASALEFEEFDLWGT